MRPVFCIGNSTSTLLNLRILQKNRGIEKKALMLLCEKCWAMISTGYSWKSERTLRKNWSLDSNLKGDQESARSLKTEGKSRSFQCSEQQVQGLMGQKKHDRSEKLQEFSASGT